jgi:uncharacterized RDD family membrane protein YckC
VVTPEGVLIDLPTASVASRALAKLLDLLIIIVGLQLVLTVLSLFVGVAFGGIGGASDIGVIVLVVASLVLSLAGFVGYPIVFEALWGGRTPGKAALGLRVVTREGAPIRLRHSAVRNLIGLVECLMLGFVAVLTCTLSRTNQRIGDLAAGTIVWRERSGTSGTGVVRFPPPLGMDAYIASLDVSAMTAEQYNLVRAFLVRVLEFGPAAREALAVRLAHPLASGLAHTPPAGVSPELYLACTASAYQFRHMGPLPMAPAFAWAPGPWPSPPPPPMARYPAPPSAPPPASPPGSPWGGGPSSL